jgi:CPA2 family monovalent cation:H+ antiporter-2
VPAEAYSLVLAGALLTITLNPLAFSLVAPMEDWLQRRPQLVALLERPRAGFDIAPSPKASEGLRGHVVLVGFGRVGRRIGYALERANIPYVVVERNQNTVEALRKRGIPAVFGDAARPGILDHVRLEYAQLLVVASPDPYHARAIVEVAKRLHPGIEISARAHSEAGQRFLENLGVDHAFMGERELALSMAHHTLMRMGRTDDEADETVNSMRMTSAMPSQWQT